MTEKVRGIRLAVFRDAEGAVAAGSYFIQDRVDEVACVSQFEDHPIGREPCFTEPPTSSLEDRIFKRLFRLHPFLLIFPKLFAELMFHVGIF